MRTPLCDTVDAVRKNSHCVRMVVAGENEEMVENMPLYIYAFHRKYRLYEDKSAGGECASGAHWQISLY